MRCLPGQLVKVDAFSHEQFLNSCSAISEPFCSCAFTVHSLIVPLTDTPTMTSSCYYQECLCTKHLSIDVVHVTLRYKVCLN